MSSHSSVYKLNLYIPINPGEATPHWPSSDKKKKQSKMDERHVPLDDDDACL